MKIVILTGLFERFDPSIYYIFEFQFNWIFVLVPIIFLCNRYWLIPSRSIIIINLLLNIVYNEFSVSIGSKNLFSNVLIFTGIIFYLILLNFFSLFPYVFPSTRHLIFNLSISLSILTGILIFSIYSNYLKFMSHLVPYNSPKPLINFIVIIELIRYLIRPMTLAIRLSSNLIAGHLILILLSNFIIKFIYLMPLRLLVQNTLLVLEISISVIQAYVYSVLITLYFKESNRANEKKIFHIS